MYTYNGIVPKLHPLAPSGSGILKTSAARPLGLGIPSLPCFSCPRMLCRGDLAILPDSDKQCFREVSGEGCGGRVCTRGSFLQLIAPAAPNPHRLCCVTKAGRFRPVGASENPVSPADRIEKPRDAKQSRGILCSHMHFLLTSQE